MKFDNIAKILQKDLDNIKPELVIQGKIVKIGNNIIEARGCFAAIGDICTIICDKYTIQAEVIALNKFNLILMSYNSTTGINIDAKVEFIKRINTLIINKSLLGKVLDPHLKPINHLDKIDKTNKFKESTLSPLDYHLDYDFLDTGVKAINTFTSICYGQKLGIYASSGVGKTSLLGMIAKGAKADIIIIALIGERQREIKEFIYDVLGENQSKAILVVAPANVSPALKIRALENAIKLAKYFRDDGLNVLFLIDSITRFAQATREVAFACGESSAIRGYPSSSLTKISHIIEDTSSTKIGSITSFYTILVEGEVVDDIIVDTTKAILDGHIYLSDDLARINQYPAIDIYKSISRVMPRIISNEHQELLNQILPLLGLYEENKDLISINAYTKGSDANIDKAIRIHDIVKKFLHQAQNELVDYETCINTLITSCNTILNS